MKDKNTDANSAATASQRTAAIVLIVVNVLSTVAMMHHPTAHGDSYSGFLQSVNAIRGLNQLVHGALIAFVLITWLCLIEFALPHWKRASVRNGILLYTVGIFALIGAALTNGFVLIRLAEDLANASNELQAASPLLFKLTWAVNQTFDNLGVIAMCAGIASVSLHLLSSTKVARLLGIAGLVMVVAQLGMQFIHQGHFGVHEMLIFVAWHSLWCIAMAMLVLRKSTQ